MQSSKHQNKKLPNELLADIFKAADGAIMENLLPKVLEDFGVSSLKQKEFERMWTNQVITLLTSSSIIYIFVGESFKKRWTQILELGKEIKKLEGYLIFFSNADEREKFMEEREKLVEERERLFVVAETLEIYERIVEIEARRRLNEEQTRLAGKRKRWGSCQILVGENGGTILRRTRSHYDLSLTD
ncbi:unnamed protein product [Meloidogyne enterolobii]|uniref:Uncharacterized protein n=1 Tax=Meloidogyne enterolobii TaxID=390850 RepID=A0ACB0ZCI5_MELEN